MSTYLGKSINECGDIRKIIPIYKEGNQFAYTSYEPTAIRAIFKKDRLIWPLVAKYKFWISLDPEDHAPASRDIYVTVKAGWQKTPGSKPTSEPHPITVYVKTCTRSGRQKYPYVVQVLDDWITVNNYTDTKAELTPSEESIDFYDDSFTLYIKNNPSLSDRGTRVRIYQLDPVTGLPTPQSDLIYIHVVQQADEPYGSAEFGTGTRATWYTDANFNVPCKNYGFNDDGASPINGQTSVYVKILGQTWMWSGTTRDANFGDNGEFLDGNSLQSTNIKSISTPAYKGNGNWTSTIYWKDNPMTAASKHVAIGNVTLLPGDTIPYGGSSGTLTFTLSNEGTAVRREIPVTLQIPSSSKWEGSATLRDSVTCYQEGGTVTVPIVDDNAIPVLTKDLSASWLTITSNPKRITSNKYSASFTASSSPLVQKSQLEDVKFFQEGREMAYLSAYLDECLLQFKIYMNDAIYEERKCTFTIKYGGGTASVTLTQSGSEIGNWYEVSKYNHPELIDNKMLVIYKKDENGKIVTSVSSITYSGSGWRATLKLNENPKYQSDPVITIVQVPTTVSSGIHDDTTNDTLVKFRIVSGEVNSETRSESLIIYSSTIYLNEEVEVMQQASSDASATVYHDTEKCTVRNETDDKTVYVTSADKSHTYSCNIIISENNNKEDTVAYTKPMKISAWSCGLLSNDMTSIVYVQVKGYPAYKGKERTIEVFISCGICKERRDFELKQEAKTAIYDYTKEEDCSVLEQSDFVLDSKSEASLSKTNYPKYTGNGWYEVTVDVNKNTTPASKECHVTIDGTDVAVQKEYRISQHLVESVHPLNAWWNQTGKPVSRSATMTVAEIEDTKLSLSWPYVPYLGDQRNMNIYGSDWSLVQNTGNTWLSISNDGSSMTAAKNLTLTKNTSSITFSFLDKNGSDALAPVTINVTQDPLQNIEELGYVIKRTSDQDIVIEENGGELVPVTITIESHDGEWNACDIDFEWQEGLSISKKMMSGYGVQLSVSASTHNHTSKSRTWTLKLSQLDKDNKSYTGKTVTVPIEQPGYSLSATISTKGTEAKIDTTDTSLEIQVTSTKTTTKGSELAQFTISQDDYSWLAIGDETVSSVTTRSYSAKAIHINDSDKNLTTLVTVTQADTMMKSHLRITNKNWKASEFDETWIELDKADEQIYRTFYSRKDESVIPLSSHVKKWDNSTNPLADPSWVTTKIVQDNNGYDYALDVTSGPILVGDVSVTGVLKISNGVYGIGSLRITKNAYRLKMTSEDALEQIVYVSSTTETLWSMYYVYSFRNGISTDYDVIVDTTAIRVTKTDNAIMLIPVIPNVSSNRVSWTGRIVQHDSGWTIPFIIIQLTSAEEEKYQLIL